MRTPAITTWLRGGCLAVLISLMPLAITGSGVGEKAACADGGTCAPEAGSYCAHEDGVDVNYRPVYNATK